MRGLYNKGQTDEKDALSKKLKENLESNVIFSKSHNYRVFNDIDIINSRPHCGKGKARPEAIKTALNYNYKYEKKLFNNSYQTSRRTWWGVPVEYLWWKILYTLRFGSL